MVITKRDGKIVPYDKDKIFRAISSANNASVEQMTEDEVNIVTSQVEDDILNSTNDNISVEQIQDIVEHRLMSNGFFEIAKKYIMYRQKHTIRRNVKRNLMETYKDVLFSKSNEADFKRENANINTNAPMGIMYKLGSEGAKHFVDEILPEEFAEADREHFVHYHDKDMSLITLNCCQIDLVKLFRGGFSTGQGYIREPNSIRAYAALACIAIQSNQSDQFGGQSVNCWCTAMAEGIRKSFYKAILNKMYEVAYINNTFFRERPKKRFFEIMKEFMSINDVHYSERSDRVETKEQNDRARESTIKSIKLAKLDYFSRTGCMLFDNKNIPVIYDFACDEVEEETHQAMEAMVHNMNTLRSRSGGQVPFSSINFGMNTSPEGRLAIRETLNAIDAGLGKKETPLFPISIFQIKDGVNYNEGDINYDLFKLACKVSAKRLYPSFVSLDASFNIPYYKPGDYNSYIATMGKRKLSPSV